MDGLLGDLVDATLARVRLALLAVVVAQRDFVGVRRRRRLDERLAAGKADRAGLWLLLHVVSIARASWLIYERTRQLGEVYHPSGHDLQVAVRKEKERVRAPSLHQATRKAASSRTLHTTAVTTTASGGRGEAEGESGAQARGAGRLEAAHQSTLGQRQSGNV